MFWYNFWNGVKRCKITAKQNVVAAAIDTSLVWDLIRIEFVMTAAKVGIVSFYQLSLDRYFIAWDFALGAIDFRISNKIPSKSGEAILRNRVFRNSLLSDFLKLLSIPGVLVREGNRYFV